jgi:hypothetical protein
MIIFVSAGNTDEKWISPIGSFKNMSVDSDSIRRWDFVRLTRVALLFGLLSRLHTNPRRTRTRARILLIPAFFAVQLSSAVHPSGVQNQALEPIKLGFVQNSLLC